MANIEKAKLIQGWVEEDELNTIATWAMSRPKIIEIGTWKGRTTRALCDNNSGEVVTIDNWKGALVPVDNGFWELDEYGPDYVYNVFMENLKDHLDSGKLTVVKGFSADAVKVLINKYGFEYFDMLWIDGGHEYEVVRKDIIYYRPLLKPKAQLCGHDFYYPGVKQSLDELIAGYWHSGNLWSKEI